MTGKTVLVVGSGGREHAIAWALTKAPEVSTVLIAPGNAGTSSVGENISVNVMNLDHLVKVAQEYHVDLVAVGPEVPLAAGLVDRLMTHQIPAFGPMRDAAQLEASKAFSKAFMQRHNIPTAGYATFEDYTAAVTYVKELGRPLVVKADGLAAGKGVVVCDTTDEAIDALQRIFVDEEFGTAGHKVVIEERLTGPELSVMAFCDGETVRVMPPARDHKRIMDNDQGPNTGGMGAFTPVPGVSETLIEEIRQSVLLPAINGLKAEGICYKGVLYAGMMLTPDGPKTLEFNCRFGDPETQVVLPLLESSLYEVMMRCIDGTLSEMEIQWQDSACATVVAASAGYPASYKKGVPIFIADRDAIVFHAGTDLDEQGELVTSGGRVLAVSAVGDTLEGALQQAYQDMQKVSFEGMHYRRDIGRT